MWSFSSSPAPCSPPCTLITAQAPPHLLSFLKSSSSQPQECQAILSGSSASPFLFSHVRMCHSTELCRYMLGGWCFFFFPASVPGVQTNGLRTKQGAICTSLPGHQRPFYCFYTKIFPFCLLFVLVLTNVSHKRSRGKGEKKSHICIHQQYYFRRKNNSLRGISVIQLS